MQPQAESAWVCAGCRRERGCHDPSVSGPDPQTPAYGPLLWDSGCLRRWTERAKHPEIEASWAATEDYPGWRVRT